MRMDAPRQRQRPPHFLTEVQVEALLDAPDVDEPIGLRDRAMLELIYASGLRVSELVTLKTVYVSLADGVLHHWQRFEGAPGALGAQAAEWLTRYTACPRGDILDSHDSDALFVTSRGGPR